MVGVDVVLAQSPRSRVNYARAMLTPTMFSRRRSHQRAADERLVEYSWRPHQVFVDQQTYRGPQFTDLCVNSTSVRFHRIRDFKQYYFNSVPPTSQQRCTNRGVHCKSTWIAYDIQLTSGLLIGALCSRFGPASRVSGAVNE